MGITDSAISCAMWGEEVTRGNEREKRKMERGHGGGLYCATKASMTPNVLDAETDQNSDLTPLPPSPSLKGSERKCAKVFREGVQDAKGGKTPRRILGTTRLAEAGREGREAYFWPIARYQKAGGPSHRIPGRSIRPRVALGMEGRCGRIIGLLRARASVHGMGMAMSAQMRPEKRCNLIVCLLCMCGATSPPTCPMYTYGKKRSKEYIITII